MGSLRQYRSESRNDSKTGTAEPERRRERVNASYGFPETKANAQPAVRGAGPREGRAEQSSGTEVAADGTCRVADRASRRKLERFEASVVTVDSFGFLPGRVPSRRQPACDESSMGLCHLVKSGTLVTGSGRPLRRSDRKVRSARRCSKARSPPQRGRIERTRTRGPWLADLSAGCIGAEGRERCLACRVRRSHYRRTRYA